MRLSSLNDPMSDWFVSQELIQQLRSKYPDQILLKSGISSELASDLIQLSQRYQDELAKSIQRVALKTGIRFPHQLQRLIEIFGLSFLPNDKLWVLASTPHELRIRFQSCELRSRLELDCPKFCLELIKQLCTKLDLKVELNLVSFAPCEFQIRYLG